MMAENNILNENKSLQIENDVLLLDGPTHMVVSDDPQ